MVNKSWIGKKVLIDGMVIKVVAANDDGYFSRRLGRFDDFKFFGVVEKVISGPYDPRIGASICIGGHELKEYKEPVVVEMTMKEVCAALGREIKIKK